MQALRRQPKTWCASSERETALTATITCL